MLIKTRPLFRLRLCSKSVAAPIAIAALNAIPSGHQTAPSSDGRRRGSDRHRRVALLATIRCGRSDAGRQPDRPDTHQPSGVVSLSGANTSWFARLQGAIARQYGAGNKKTRRQSGGQELLHRASQKIAGSRLPNVSYRYERPRGTCGRHRHTASDSCHCSVG